MLANKRSSIAINTLLLGIAIIAASRWWLAPRRAAARASQSDEARELRRVTIETLAEMGIDVSLDDRRAEAGTLRWRAPGECVELYRFRVDERYRDASVETFVGRPEEHATYQLALARDPTRSASEQLQPVIATLTRPDADTRVRELWWGEVEVGPSAPDFACRRRSWDPLEDALAFGWPKLPGSSTRVGERWVGAHVEGRCHETVCLDVDGSFNPNAAVPCRARPWSERLVGAEGELAVILGDWDDGHDPARPEFGILTSRELVIDEGRPRYAKAVIEHRWSGVRRELSLVRVDDCAD